MEKNKFKLKTPPIGVQKIDGYNDINDILIQMGYTDEDIKQIDKNISDRKNDKSDKRKIELMLNTGKYAYNND